MLQTKRLLIKLHDSESLTVGSGDEQYAPSISDEAVHQLYRAVNKFALVSDDFILSINLS